MSRKANPNAVGPMFNDYGVPIPAKQSTWRSRALAAAAELAVICKAGPRQRGSKGSISYQLDSCPITGESFPDQDPFSDSPRISLCRDSILVFTMADLQGDHLHELVIKLRAAGHALPRVAEYEDAVRRSIELIMNPELIDGL
jgi:hypothetical protein